MATRERVHIAARLHPRKRRYRNSSSAELADAHQPLVLEARKATSEEIAATVEEVAFMTSPMEPACVVVQRSLHAWSCGVP